MMKVLAANEKKKEQRKKKRKRKEKQKEKKRKEKKEKRTADLRKGAEPGSCTLLLIP